MGAGHQPAGDRRRGSEIPLDRPLDQVPGDGRSNGGEPDEPELTEFETRELSPERDQQRNRGAGVEADLEGLAQLWIDALIVPPKQPCHDLDVCRG